jgi:hypothetical protein
MQFDSTSGRCLNCRNVGRTSRISKGKTASLAAVVYALWVIFDNAAYIIEFIKEELLK